MGQPERFEQRPVHREHGAVGHGQREAHLAFEGQRVDLCVDDGVIVIDRTLIVRALTIEVMDLTTTLLGSAP